MRVWYFIFLSLLAIWNSYFIYAEGSQAKLLYCEESFIKSCVEWPDEFTFVLFLIHICVVTILVTILVLQVPKIRKIIVE